MKISSLGLVFALLSVSLPVLVHSQSVESEAVVSVSDAVKSQVEARFRGRWDALIAKKFDTSYTYESPAYREQYSSDDYRESFSKDLTWNSVVLDEVKFEGENKAVLSYALDFVFKTPWGGELADISRHTEEWFLQDGEWWHDKSPNSLSGVKSK